MSDLVERLRGEPDFVPWPERLLNDAADEISRLRKEVEDLREALDILQRTKGRTTDPDDDGLLGLGM